MVLQCWLCLYANNFGVEKAITFPHLQDLEYKPCYSFLFLFFPFAFPRDIIFITDFVFAWHLGNFRSVATIPSLEVDYHPGICLVWLTKNINQDSGRWEQPKTF